MAEKINIAELGIDIKDVLSQQSKLLEQIEQLKSAQKSLKKDTDNFTNSTESQRKAYATQEAQLATLNKEYRINKGLLAELKTGSNSLADALTRENKTIQDLQKNNKELNEIKKRQNITTEEGRKAIEDINKRIDENNEKLKENASQMGKQKMNIGNYQSALDGLKGKINGVGLALKAMGVGLVLAAFAKLSEIFQQNQKVADFFSTVMESVNIVLSDLVNLVVGNFGNIVEFFKGVFNDPLGSIKSLGTAIRDNLIERFKSLIETFGFAGRAIKALFSGDFEEAGRLAKEAGKELVDSFTGVDNSLEKATKAVVNYGSEVVKTAKRNVQLANSNELAVAKQQLIIQTLERQAEQLRQIRDDEFRTFDERIAANEELSRVLEKQIQQELKQVQVGIELAKANVAKNDNIENQVALTEALTAEADLLNRIEGQRSEQLTNQFQLLREKAEAETAHKVAIQETTRAIEEEFKAARQRATEIQNEEAINALIERGATEFEIRQAQLEQQRQAELADLNARIEAGEGFERERTLIEQRYAKNREEINALEQQTKLDQTQAVLGQIAGLTRENTILSRIAASANALINTYEGATAQLSLPFPLNFIAKAATIASGLSAVARINGVQLFADGTERVTGPGTERSDSIPAMLSRNERVVDAKTNRQIGFDLSNSELASAAQMYRFYKLNGFYPAGKQAKAGSPKVNNMVNVQVEDGMKYKVVNKSKYLS